MGVKLTGPWDRTLVRLGQGPRVLERGMRKALGEEAQFFREQAVVGIRSQRPGGRSFRQLAASTLASRRAAGFGGSQALIRSRSLVRSIIVVERREGFFVGVPRGTRGAGGSDLFLAARAAEEGLAITIRLTPKMRRFLFAVLGQTSTTSPRGDGTVRIRVPARPVFRPTLDRFGRPDIARARMRKRLERLLSPLLGPI